MTDDILRSGVPHAVETNLVTRHAINPRHVFSDVDPSAEKTAHPDAPPAQTKHSGDAATGGPPQSDQHLQDNIQSLGKTSFADNWQSVSQQTHQNNTQKIGKEHLQDNRQAIQEDRIGDNHQSLGAPQAIQEKKLYLEKKSIKDNRQKVAETVVQRAAPQWPSATDGAAPKSDNTRSIMKGRGANASASSSPVAPAISKIQDDDELQARMQKLKAKVRHVNETLSDLDPDA